MPENKIQSRLIPLTEWPKHHLWPPLGGLRHLVFNAKAKGFENVVVRSAGRILIDENAFFLWLSANNKKQGGSSHE